MVKVIRTKFKKNRYIAAAGITLLIFALGMMLGFVMDSKRVDYIAESANEQKVDYNSLQVQYQFVEQLFEEKDCNAISKAFENNLENLEKTRIELEKYQIDSTLEDANFDLLTREYVIAQMRYYLLAEKTRTLCNIDFVSIFYFYSDDKICPNCNNQAFILTYMKKLMEDKVLIFSFNSKMYKDEPLIEMLMDRYEVSAYPTIVINNKKFEGMINKQETQDAICSNLKKDYDFCQ